MKRYRNWGVVQLWYLIDNCYWCITAYWYCGYYKGSVQSLSCVWFFVTPWTTACQASLSITNSQSLLKLMSAESVMPWNHLLLCRPLLLLPSISQHQGLLKWVSSSHQVAKVLEFQLQHRSFRYSGLISFRMDWLDLPAVQGTLKSLLQHHSFPQTVLSRPGILPKHQSCKSGTCEAVLYMPMYGLISSFSLCKSSCFKESNSPCLHHIFISEIN